MSKKNNFAIFYAISLAWQLGFVIIVPIGGFLFLGLLIDKFLKTKPIFLIIFLLLGIITTVYETYYLFIPLIKKNKKLKNKNKE